MISLLGGDSEDLSRDVEYHASRGRLWSWNPTGIHVPLSTESNTWVFLLYNIWDWLTQNERNCPATQQLCSSFDVSVSFWNLEWRKEQRTTSLSHCLRCWLSPCVSRGCWKWTHSFPAQFRPHRFFMQKYVKGVWLDFVYQLRFVRFSSQTVAAKPTKVLLITVSYTWKYNHPRNQWNTYSFRNIKFEPVTTNMFPALSSVTIEVNGMRLQQSRIISFCPYLN